MRAALRILALAALVAASGVWLDDAQHAPSLGAAVPYPWPVTNTYTGKLFHGEPVSLLLLGLSVALFMLSVFPMFKDFSFLPKLSWWRPAEAAAGAGAAPAAAQPTLTTDFREFLPAALELLETPPSPVRLAAIWIICAGVVSTLGWSYLCFIDIHAVAMGKIQPSGRSKVVQPLEPGRVVSVMVENGSKVAAGDVLVQLDPTESTADRDANARDLESMNGEAARRRVAVALASGNLTGPRDITFPDGVGEQIKARETTVLNAELDQLIATRDSLKAQLEERQATITRLRASITQREQLLALAKERVDMRSTLNDQGALSRALVIDSLQQYQQQMTVQVGEQGQLTEAEASVRTLEKRMAEATNQFIAEQTQKLIDAERKRDRLEQDLIKSASKSSRTKLVAPIAGTVQQLSITTIGQVVGSGQSLMTIVPADSPIEIEAMIENQDIGFVEPGQEAIVKVEAFPFTRYGTLDGTVISVSRDAVEQQAANPGDAANGGRQPQGGGAQQTGRANALVFPATVRLKSNMIDVDGKQIPLSPGMAVTVEVKTGKRRAIDYVLSPIREVQSSAARER